jgi:arginine decarboxylase
MKMNDLAALRVQTLTQRIELYSATGEGATPPAAFDAARVDAGAAHCSRLRESSLIAPNTSVVRASARSVQPVDGGRLYVVMSQIWQCQPGRYACAGVGWVQRHDDGSGLFIDLHDDDRDRLEHDLHAAFGAIACLRDASYGPVQTVFASRLCNGAPVCALVVAAYAGKPG